MEPYDPDRRGTERHDREPRAKDDREKEHVETYTRGKDDRGRPTRRREADGKKPRGREPQGREPQGREPRGKEPRGREPRGTAPRGRELQGRELRGKDSRGELARRREADGTERRGTERRRADRPAAPGRRSGRPERTDGPDARSRGAGDRMRGPARGAPAGGRPERAGRETARAPEPPVRLQSFLARAGIASRRGSEELIAAGRVTVNGRPVEEPGTKVVPGSDRVAVDGKPVGAKQPVWVMLHKPRGYVTTRHDPQDRRTIYDLLPPAYHHLFHVGRLDRQSEGLLLLTNEGEAANRLLHPRYGVEKEYVATIEGEPTHEALERLVEGVELEGEVLYAESIEVLPSSEEGRTRLRLVLREGRYREIRRMLEAVGHTVHKLSRKRFGPLRLGQLRRGEWRLLTPAELEHVRASGGGPSRSR